MENAAQNASWTSISWRAPSPGSRNSPFLFVLADALPDDLLDLRIVHLLEAGRLDALRTQQSYLAPPRARGTIDTPVSPMAQLATQSTSQPESWDPAEPGVSMRVRVELCSGKLTGL